MIKKALILSVLLVAVNISFGQDSQKALEYMNVISAEFKNIQSATWEYTKSVAKNKSAKKVEKTRIDLLKTIDQSIAKVKKIPAYSGNSYFRDSTVSFLELNKSVVAQDYEKIMDLEEIAEQSYDLMEAYMLAQDVANQKISDAGDRIIQVEKRFAEEHNITLIDGGSDKISEKLKKAGEMYDYYNPIYLLFFKAYKQELYFLDALQRGDLSGMEQNNSMLAQTAKECIDSLKKIKDFNGDLSLKNTCMEILNFYLDESKSKFTVFIDFQAKKEGFEKAKSNMESKKEKDRTKEDIDNYNSFVKEYNAATAEYNKVNNELNSKRSKLINSWNNSSSNFTSKHL